MSRRNHLMELTATPAGPSRPDLPASILRGPLFDKNATDTLSARHLVLNSLWHFDETSYSRALIRHVDTSVTFAVVGTRDDHLAVQHIHPDYFEQPADESFAAWPAEKSLAMGHAARFVAAHATLIVSCRRARHQGAVFFRYTSSNRSDPCFDPTTTDAPPFSVSPTSTAET